VILGAAAGNDPVSEASCGFTIAPEDPEALAAAMRRMADMSAEHRKEMGERGQAYVLANHDYRVLARKFIGVLEESV